VKTEAPEAKCLCKCQHTRASLYCESKHWWW